MDLVLGYNGLGRIFGASGGGRWRSGGRRIQLRWCPPGLGRLFSSEMCCEISWLLPVAPLVMAFGIYPAIRRGTNALSRNTEAALVMWAGWLVVTALVFIYMGGTIHPYDTVALSPAIAALVGIAAGWAWS